MDAACCSFCPPSCTLRMYSCGSSAHSAWSSSLKQSFGKATFSSSASQCSCMCLHMRACTYTQVCLFCIAAGGKGGNNTCTRTLMRSQSSMHLHARACAPTPTSSTPSSPTLGRPQPLLRHGRNAGPCLPCLPHARMRVLHSLVALLDVQRVRQVLEQGVGHARAQVLAGCQARHQRHLRIQQAQGPVALQDKDDWVAAEGTGDKRRFFVKTARARLG